VRRAAREIVALGPRSVVIKGGHLPGDPVDVLFDGQEFYRFPATRVQTKNTHGTGCTFSAAIATQLARGASVVEAVGVAKRYLDEAIRRAVPIGHGHGPVLHDWLLTRTPLT
jgi:hydroxymethylpyrimidine/phosphomethylpyrimidine kinase